MPAVPKLVLCDFPAETGVEGWASLSPYVLEVERALRLAKLPFEHRRVNMLRLKELNPTGQLPVLLVDDEKVADSTRILQRIEALSPGSLTGGLDARGIAEAWLWEEFADTSLYPYVLASRWADDKGWPVPKKAFFGFLPPVVRDVVATAVRKKTIDKLVGRDFLRSGLDICYERMHRVLDALEQRAPEHGFWMGENATVADLGLFAHLHSLRLPLLPWRAQDIERRARLSSWLDRVDSATRAPVA